MVKAPGPLVRKKNFSATLNDLNLVLLVTI